MQVKPQRPLFVSIPHSGERVPTEASWLLGLPEAVLMCDVDRYVDRLYAGALERLQIPFIKTEWHRYAVDLNRLPEDVDRDSVEGHTNPSGKFSRGLIWTITTTGQRLLPKPVTAELHRRLVEAYYNPFHQAIRAQYQQLRNQGYQQIFHIDLHSMPSRGTSEHRDPGESRQDVVVSDSQGRSCSQKFRDLVVEAYRSVGFSVSLNWPYYGGRVTETYGQPQNGQHAIQVELNRSLYMDEVSKAFRPELASGLQPRLQKALDSICRELDSGGP